MSTTNIPLRRLRLALLATAERLTGKYRLGEEYAFELETGIPHLRAQRYDVKADEGVQFMLERACGADLALCLASEPVDCAGAMAIEQGLFPGAALLQAVDSFGLAALDPSAPGGWRITSGMPRRSAPIADLTPLLLPLMLALAWLWQREMRRVAKAVIAPGAVIRAGDMMNFIVDAIKATGWPFTEAQIRAERPALVATLRGTVA
jgi:hypothetical protein